MNKQNQTQSQQQAEKPQSKTAKQEIQGMETAVITPIPSLQRAYTNPRTLSPADAQTLQRTIGNQALGRLIIQRKMTVGPVGDKYEQEADTVAKQVVSKLNTPSPQTSSAQTAQRQEDEEELQMKPLVQRQEEEELQMKPLPAISSLQRQEEEELQMKPLLQRQEEEELQAKGDPMLAGGELSGDVESSVQSAKSGGQPMSDNIRVPIEQAFNADFSGVKVHTDSQSDTLNRSLSARAFTSGQDIFFRSGEYNPGSTDGQELLAHELTHTIQQNGGRIQKSQSDVIQPKYHPAQVGRNAHLRKVDVWNTHHGPQINSGSQLLIDDDITKAKKQSHRIGSTTWRPAINVPPNHQNAVNDNRKGYIRNKSITFQGTALDEILKLRIKNILQTAEAKFPSLAGHLDKDENIAFLLEKGIRYKEWNSSPNLDGFASGFSSKEDKLTRIRDGANYVADSLEHWRKWLSPLRADEVKIQTVKFLKSDLHEEGLGVLAVTYTKPQGPVGHKFENDTNVELIVKPEDKSLEENLLGDKPDSAANQINEIVGLSDNEALATIKMACSLQYGSIVEKVKGTKAEDLVGHSNLRIEPAFHETLVFAFLAGIDDLHGENVYWHKGKPYLIDADNVLSYNQMINKANGAIVQSGFGSGYSTEEATMNKESIKTLKNTVKSKILQTMIENPAKGARIIEVIKNSVAGKEARVVPIRTQKWGGIVSSYPVTDDKNGLLDFYSKSSFIVREDTGFLESSGPGLFGTSFKNTDDEFYDKAAEMAELKKDFDAGVIPFYTYKFNTGYVYHNGTKIYHGQTSEQAMQIMIDKFTPEWDAQWREYMQLRQELDEI